MTDAELQRIKEELRAELRDEIIADLKDRVRVVPPPQYRPTVHNDIRAMIEGRLVGRFDLLTLQQIMSAIYTIIRTVLKVPTVKLLNEAHRERATKIATTILDLYSDGRP